MPESSASKRGSDWESPLGGEGMEKDLGHLQVLCTPFPLILGSCPGVFLCPRERVWE